MPFHTFPFLYLPELPLKFTLNCLCSIRLTLESACCCCSSPVPGSWSWRGLRVTSPPRQLFSTRFGFIHRSQTAAVRVAMLAAPWGRCADHLIFNLSCYSIYVFQYISVIWFALPASHILLRNLVCRLASHSTYNDIFPWIGVTNVKYPCWEYFLLVRNIHKGSHFFPALATSFSWG